MALIDKASLLMVPSTYEAGTLYNVLPSGNRAPDSTGENSGYDQTRADFTFDRGSNTAATRVNSDGLIEKYRENEALQSNSFNVSPWSLGNSVLTANASTSPTGESNATKIESNTIGTETRVRQTISGATTGKVYTFSCYMKAGNVSYGIIRHYGISSNGRAWFNLSNGTIGTKDSSLIDAQIESVGDGWYRCSITGKITTSGALDLAPAPNDNDYLSDAANDYIFLYGAQAETGLVATDYLDSGATTAKAGVLIDLPRINYDANGENGSLLLEPSRQQLIQYSEYFGGTGWSLDGGVQSVTSNYSISPEGVKNAARLQLDKTGTTYSRLYVDAGSIGEATISVYMKSNTSQTQNVGLRYDGTGVNCEVTTEWKRFDLTATSTAGSLFQILLFDSIAGNDETADISIYGAQMEAASYATSYIPNHGESGGVTRAADSCSVTGVSDVIGQTEGTLFVEATNLFVSGIRTISLLYTSGSAYYQIYINASNQVRVDVNGLFIFSGGTITTNTKYKIAFAYKSGEYALYINGTQISTSVSTTMPSSLNNFYLGNSLGGEQSGAYKQSVLFNERLTNEELATLTTL